jgi:precorrin-6B methylase 2
MPKNKKYLVGFALILLILSAGLSLAAEKAKFMRNPDVVYVGTAYDVVSRMLQMGKVKKSDMVYDLGCGDARMLVLAAQKYGSHGVGYDIDPERIRASEDNVERNHVDKLVKIEQADMFTLDLSKADVIPMYLLPEMNRKLLPQLEKMKPGSRIVCHNYDLDGIIADETVTMVSNEDGATHTLWLYTIPLKHRN